MFMILDLIERCPFLAMRTAAIGLLKDRVSTAIKNYKTNKVKIDLIFNKKFPHQFDLDFFDVCEPIDY